MAACRSCSAASAGTVRRARALSDGVLTPGLGSDHADPLVTSLMRYDAHVSRGSLWMDPVLPESYGDLHITNAPMAGGRITIDIAGSVPLSRDCPKGWCSTAGTGLG
jgi:hypothetical protein